MKRLPFYALAVMIFLFSIPGAASARSFSIDDAAIRAWIMPNGDLVVNEVFSYTFEGEYNRVIRSLPKNGTWSVSNFEAYELMNPEGLPGFINKDEIKPLSVTQEENTYYANFPVKDSEKKFFFMYLMKNAVNSYDTYSDLTIPFFGTDKNHGTDIHNVTLDIVFPSRLDPEQYHAFFHGNNGSVEVKNNELVRFSQPVSHAGQLTEVRVLFPSAIMHDQAKAAAPMSLEEAVAEEETIVEEPPPSIPEEKGLIGEPLFLTLTVAFLITSVLFLLLPQRRLRAAGNPERLLDEDPLYLYVVDRAGKKDFHAIFAGLYSLVYQGKAKMEKTESETRLQRDPEAPGRTLAFILEPLQFGLGECEDKLVDWLFRKRIKLGRRYFSLNKLYGTTGLEKKEKDIYMYRNKQANYYKKEHEWFTCVLDRMKEEGVLGSRIYAFMSVLLSSLSLLSVLILFLETDASAGRIFFYLIVSLFLLRKNWKGKRRGRMYLFFLASVLFINTVDDRFIALTDSLSVMIVCAALLYALIPRYILSREAAEVRAEIRYFRKMLNKDGIPSSVSAGKLDKWMILATLLNVKSFKMDTKPFEGELGQLAAAAPLSYLVLQGEEPAQYMIQTWKWSKPAGTPFWDTSSGQSSSSSGDSGGWTGSSGGDGGGGDGGGAGAD